MKLLDSSKTILFVFAVILSGCKMISPEKGVSLQLAHERKRQISNVEYTLQFSIPAKKIEKITGKTDINLTINRKEDVVIDFREKASNILGVKANSLPVKYRFINGHIIIPKKQILKGKNTLSINFIAGDGSLNRKDDFLYTLLVPDRASTVFPCFDQPDLKANYNLTLTIPKEWSAVTNGELVKTVKNDSIKTLSFGETKPLSTYLFAFAIGKFDSVSRTEGGRTITMYHRENDSIKVKRNLDAIFKSHFHSLAWMKDYTGIDYPFGKFDIVLIPDFQYGGMEHPGAIYYRDSQLFLDENPSVNQKLRRANLIAHETSHQWFGDLVTMRWFNDVWLKEVFAGFMADKIVNPQYPEIDHDLNFLLSHYPRAYSIDRTSGANPIRQNLENLLFAGTLYGDIIYHKAPIMMMQLELLMGKDAFQKGLKQYLKTYSLSNADWEDLIAILDPLTPQDLNTWSKSWVDEPGMPNIVSYLKLDSKKKIEEYQLIQSKTGSKTAKMGMLFSITQNTAIKNNKLNLKIVGDSIKVDSLQNQAFGNYILPNSDGKGYGAFYPDSISFSTLFKDSLDLNDNHSRASWFVTLNELFMNGKINKNSYFKYLIEHLKKENEPQIRQYLLSTTEQVWWSFFNSDERKNYIQYIENCLLTMLNSKDIKENELKPIFWAYTRVAVSNDAQKQVFKIWENKTRIKGVTLNETDYMQLTYELAVRNFRSTDSILTVQESRIKNKDRLAKFRFIKRAVSPDTTIRGNFFRCLSDSSNRRPEAWVSEALHYFHHPLRADFSIKYLKSALDLLPEIQRTGDIFFPKSWLDATLWGYNSKNALLIIDEWISKNSKQNKVLVDKTLQSSDILRRSIKF